MLDLDLFGDEPSLREILLSRPDPAGVVAIRQRSTRWSARATYYYGFNIYRDHRAFHLEAALDNFPVERDEWRPTGYRRPRLGRLYWRIVDALCRQFMYPRQGGDAHPFLVMHNSYRHMINVCAEAIISIWTNTPLPQQACSESRTRTIVRALGWIPVVPRVIGPSGMLSRPGPMDLERCIQCLLRDDQKILFDTGWADWVRTDVLPRVTWSEATSIGLAREKLQTKSHPHYLADVRDIISSK